MDSQTITAQLKSEARRLGFDLVGACPVVAPAGIERFRKWLANGYAGTMRYLPDRAHAYEHPKHILEGARSLLMLGMHYRTDEPAETKPNQGRVSRYAWGETDYHDLIHDRLGQLKSFLQTQLSHAKVRGVVDTAPLLERDFARLAGLGWLGKNTLLLNTEAGSWFFLAALLTDVELSYDEPFPSDHCGSCTACLDACPTDAFPQPYVLDATRCISYLTIELREAIPANLRAGVGDWLFGCDVCQDVCPWNRHAPRSVEALFEPSADMNPVQLADLFDLDDVSFRRRFRRTPLWRGKRRGLLRNAAIVLGNSRWPGAVGALIRGLGDPEPIVRGACAWALGRFRDEQTAAALRQRLEQETDNDVRQEIRCALAES